MKHLKYLRYVIRHKWYVMIECWKVGLYWRGLKHDWSKFLPDEWIPYANYFYGSGNTIKRGRDKNGYYRAGWTGDMLFDFAWLLHQKRNDHHWQWWLLQEDDGDFKVFPMSRDCALEMICDWRGAGRAIHGRDETQQWYLANKSKMKLHDNTRLFVEEVLL